MSAFTVELAYRKQYFFYKKEMVASIPDLELANCKFTFRTSTPNFITSITII